MTSVVQEHTEKLGFGRVFHLGPHFYAMLACMRRGSIQVFILILVILLLGGITYSERDRITEYLTEAREGVVVLEDVIRTVAEEQSVIAPDIEQEVITSTPLRGPTAPAPTTNLTAQGVLAWTNVHRANAGLLPLSLDTKLTAAAALKVQDMFDQQYFAHDSPQGIGAGDLAKQVAYEYILVGENLALGNYDDDQDLVQAWMDSLGHRENILHDRFTEIGIAVLEGEFEGQRVWMAVQEFGLPLSACPSPSKQLEETIDQNKAALEELNAELEDRQEELENMTPKYGPKYNRKVREYNELVEIYNALVTETKSLVNQYNQQVQAFNECASQ